MIQFLKNYQLILIFNLFIFLFGCSKAFLKYNDTERLNVDDGLPVVQIKEIGEDPNSSAVEGGVVIGESVIIPPTANTQLQSSNQLPQDFKEKRKKKRKEKPGNFPIPLKEGIVPEERTPELESRVGFARGSRRPLQDPFRIGEKVVLSVRYFKAEAGELRLEVKPFVEVNGRKSYRWFTGLNTTGMFSRFYRIDDWSETLTDFETLLPSVYEMQVKESAQLKNGKGYFDHVSRKGIYIEKKYTEKNGHQEKNQSWLIAPYAQNVFSAAFYMRIFTYEVGKEYKFMVADDEKNIVFKGKALKKENIETDAGNFDTIVVKPEFEVDGVFKPVGDIFFWLTDDDRKLIVRIEAEIKVGTLVMEASTIERGID